MSWKEAETQAELPRRQGGCDYGRARPVLVQKGNHAVVVIPGHSAWSGVGQPWEHTPTVVSLATMSGNYSQHSDLFEGRITKAKMAEAAPKIAAWLGVKVEELPAIARRKTFVWED